MWIINKDKNILVNSDYITRIEFFNVTTPGKPCFVVAWKANTDDSNFTLTEGTKAKCEEYIRRYIIALRDNSPTFDGI